MIYLMAFSSGLAALVYEVAWARMLGLGFGSTTLSAAAVIAGFMGGMGLGAWLYHRFHFRKARPLLVYGLLEIGIAVSAAMLTMVFYVLPGALAQLSESIGSGLLYKVVRFLLAFLLLLVPAILMGATFPALCTVMILTRQGVDRHLGVIYGVNTIGAALGVLVAGLLLIDWLGLTDATRVAVLINLGVGLAALALLRAPSARSETRSASPGESVIPTALPHTVTGAVLFASGFCTLGYEILWFRALRYTVGTSAYAFAVMLFTFLVGLGLGALLLHRVSRRPTPEISLALCQALIAVLAMGAMAAHLLLPEVPELFERLSIRSTEVRFRPWLWRLTVDGGLAVATMLPAAVCMGLSFPLAARLFLGDVRQLDARVGSAYVLANSGGILGAIGGAVILLPLWGTVGGTKVCAAVNIALAGLILLALRQRGRTPIFLVGSAGALVAVLLIALPGSVPLSSEPLNSGVPGEILFNEEGDLATVQVLKDPRRSVRRTMTIDGTTIGWSTGFRGSLGYRKQILLAHLPKVLDSRIRHVLNVGLGSAVTLQTLASYPEIETLDCVEISAAVVRACELFPESAVLADPRVSLIVDDALHYLQQSGPQYDLIVSDGKQDPLHAGNAIMLCREYYEYARERLTDDGLLVQWHHLDTLHDDFRISLRTVSAVFDHVELFFFPPKALLVVGSRRPLAARSQLAPDAFDSLPVGRDLSQYFLPSTAAIVGHWVAGKEQLALVDEGGPVSSWDHLILDTSPFRAPARDWNRAASENLALLIRAEEMPPSGTGPISGPDGEAYRQSQHWLRLALYKSNQDMSEARMLAQRALRANPADGGVRIFLERNQPW